MPTQGTRAPEPPPGAADTPQSVHVVRGYGGGKGVIGLLLGLLILAAAAMLAVYLFTLEARPQSHSVTSAAFAAKAHPP